MFAGRSRRGRISRRQNILSRGVSSDQRLDSSTLRLKPSALTVVTSAVLGADKLKRKRPERGVVARPRNCNE